MARTAAKKIQTPEFIPATEFNLSDSFASLLLGVVVVIAAIVLFFSFIQGKRQQIATSNPPKQLPAEKISKELQKTKQANTSVDKSSYTIALGDTLWSISEKFYNSGFEWHKIADANKITDPTALAAGERITIPNVDTRILATSTSIAKEQQQLAPPTTSPISGNTYTVMHGDDLWNIAVRAYGDGYKWVDIAKANNLTDPNLIFSDNVLKLPR